MKQHSQFFERMFRPYFIAIALVITVAMGTVYFASMEHVKNNAFDNGQQLAEKTAQQIDTYIDELDILAEQVKHNTKLLNLFYGLQSVNDTSNYFDLHVLDSIDMSSDLKNLLINRTADHNIIVYNKYGDIISSHEYIMNNARIDSLYYASELKRINDSGGKYVMFPSQSQWIKNDSVYITLAKELKNDYSNEGCGVIEVRGLVKNMFNSIVMDSDINGRISLCNRSTGEVITPFDMDNDKDENSMHITYPVSGVNWEVAIDYKNPISIVFRVQLFGVIAIVYLLLLFVGFRVTRTIGERISKPLYELTEYVRNINAADTQVHLVDEQAIDEIKELEDSFDKMLDRVNSSLLQEKKAYSMALQAQMNPHFLYNTLAVISSVGMENGCDMVSDMCTKLSDMLRYVTAYQRVTVPLRDEVEHTKNYLSLMKLRYEEYFTYSIEIDDNLNNMPVPKLFIQPLAENCFKHGFKEKEAPWYINIKMTGNSNKWKLVIYDNGTGISQDTIDEIKNKVSKSVDEHIIDSNTGLGVANTMIRLKMTHNEKLDYEIRNDSGTVIEITAGE